MKLLLKNIGKIKKAKIEIQGITVIAGENNTGKSTVGKTLFTIFDCLLRIDEKIKRERILSIRKLLNQIMKITAVTDEDELFFEHEDDEFLLEYINFLLDRINKFLKSGKMKDASLLDSELSRFFHEAKQKKIPEHLQDSVDSYVEDFKIKIKEILTLSADNYIKKILKDAFSSEFKGNIKNFYSEEDAEVNLSIKDDSIHFRINFEENYEIESVINLFTQIIYIDNPFILDDLGRFNLPYEYGTFGTYYIRSPLGHRQNLIYKLLKERENNTIEELLVEKKLSNIFEKINKPCSGFLEKHGRSYGYKEKNSNIFIGMNNLSTGIKSFLILKTLFLNGAISENGTIILDEPEIHLHPEWQIYFAEIIVLLQKEFNLHVLLTTHSPYFVEAIEVYSVKYGIKDKCHYYLAENENEISILKDVTNETDEIYSKLAMPFQILENERYHVND